jgi:hypothetical protein
LTSKPLACLLVFCLLGCFPVAASGQESEPWTTLQSFEVERTKTVSIPTQGKGRVLILNPDVVETKEISDAEVVLSGLQIGSSLIHLWDETGRRTVRVNVKELESILREMDETADKALKQRLHIPERSLRIRYRGVQESLERGKRVGLKVTEEDHRVRSHDLETRVGIPLGLLIGNFYLEQRRDDQIREQVIQPRNMALKLLTRPLGPLGAVELQAGDRDVTLSSFSLNGTRYRGFGLYPTEQRMRNGEKGRWDLTLFEGEEREGSGLDAPAGSQARAARNKFAATRLDYHLWDAGKVYLGGVRRRGKLSQNRSDHVYEAGLDWSFGNRLNLNAQLARDGPHGAWEVVSEWIPSSGMDLRSRTWNVGKAYKSVTGPVGREGQTGFENNLNFLLPFWAKAVSFSLGATLYRDRKAVNPVHPREWNSLYSFSTGIRLPWEVSFQGGASHQDQGGSPLPSVTTQYDGSLQREFRFRNPWWEILTLFAGARESHYDKSWDILGADGLLRVYRAGVRLRSFRDFSLGVTWSPAMLKESNPETLPDTIHPHLLSVEGGFNHSFKRWPAALNLSLRYDNVSATSHRTHQPFSDRDQISGSAGLTWNLGKIRDLFANLSVNHQRPETAAGDPQVDILARIGVQLDWDTGWVLTQRARISGKVFEDLNANGKPDPGEPGLEGIRICAAEGLSAVTSRQGQYVLGVKEGPVSLRVDQGKIPKGYVFTTPNVVPLVALPGQKLTRHFGVFQEVECRGIVYNDVNRNLRFDDGIDQPVSKVRFQLDSGQSGTSGPSGYYSIRRIPPGRHMTSVVLTSIPSGYETLVPIRKEWEARAGETVGYDLPLKAQRSLMGTVFEDANENQWKEESEKGMPGVRVSLDGVEAKTGEDGLFQFSDIEPGPHLLAINPRSIPDWHRLASPASVSFQVEAGPFSRDDFRFVLEGPRKPSFQKEERRLEESPGPLERFRDGVRRYWKKLSDPDPL